MIYWAKIAVPYAYIDNGWPLWRWGLLCGFVQVGLSPAFQALNVALSYWVAAPILALAMAMAVPGLAFADQELFVSLVAVAGMTPNLLAVSHVALSTLYFEHREACQSGLRRQTCSHVVGYSITAFLFCAIYDWQGLRWCIAAQLAYQALQLPYLALLAPSGWRAWRWDRAAAERAAPPEGMARQEPAAAVDGRLARPLLLAVFANNLLYWLEWNTVSAFFYERHGWGAALVGFNQMIGDVCGSAFLAASTHPLLEGQLRRFRPRRAGPRARLAGAFLLWALFSAGIVSGSPPAAAASQILMGPLYVLVQSYLVELLLASAGDVSESRRLAGAKETLVDVAGGCAAVVGLGSYTQVGPTAPYAISVAVALFSFAACAALLVERPLTEKAAAAKASDGAPTEPSEEAPAGDEDHFWI